MRSLIIIEVEHGEDTDDLQGYVESMARNATLDSENMLVFKDYTVKVDLPECFVLDKPLPPDTFWQDDKSQGTYVCDGETCGYNGIDFCSNCGYGAGE